jgi:hypothetical protein
MPKGAIYDSGDECKFSHFIPKFTPQLCLVARGLTYKQASSILSFFQAKKSAERFEKSCNQVQQAVSDLDAQGYYPSTWRVEVLLGKPGLCREKIIYAAWKEALQEPGYQALWRVTDGA